MTTHNVHELGNSLTLRLEFRGSSQTRNVTAWGAYGGLEGPEGVVMMLPQGGLEGPGGESPRRFLDGKCR